MNYYIQGGAAKADKIRAAFEKLGYDVKNWRFTTGVYYSLNGRIVNTSIGSNEYKLILNNPDYKELELPVEPKFKVGDRIRWINHDVQEQTITDIKDDSYITVDKYGIKCALKFTKQDEWELVQPKPHYDIDNFKAGMPVLVRDSDEHKWLYTIFGIYNKDNLLYPFVVVNMRGYEQCIPFEGNEHLLGTTDMPSEEYINW